MELLRNIGTSVEVHEGSLLHILSNGHACLRLQILSLGYCMFRYCTSQARLVSKTIFLYLIAMLEMAAISLEMLGYNKLGGCDIVKLNCGLTI